MRSIFADTGYWIALINPHDNLHDKAMTVGAQLGPCNFVTSEMVLVEVLNMFAERGAHLREAAFKAVRAIKDSVRTDVVPQTRQLFQDALALYSQRSDKSWSMTDCASFTIMGQRGIVDALTHDRDFEQNGYRPLLRDEYEISWTT
jgi:predicted nucleic acid-binding protein